MIGGLDELNKPKIVDIDESLLLLNSQKEQIWILGGIETKGGKARIKLSKSRNFEALSEFVNSNFYEDSHLNDSWPGYNFFDLLAKYMLMEAEISDMDFIVLHISKIFGLNLRN